MSYTTDDTLCALRAVGLAAGDCVFAHMALKKLGSFDAGGSSTFNSLFATFMKVVAPNGTLIVPTLRAQVNYRFWKSFTANIIEDWVPRTKIVDFFARKLDIEHEPRIDNEKLYRHLFDRRMLRQATLGARMVSVAKTKDLVDHLTEKLRKDNLFALAL